MTTNLQLLTRWIEKQLSPGPPPGPPPREGLKWKPTTHRWIRPEEQDIPVTPQQVIQPVERRPATIGPLLSDEEGAEYLEEIKEELEDFGGDRLTLDLETIQAIYSLPNDMPYSTELTTLAIDAESEDPNVGEHVDYDAGDTTLELQFNIFYDSGENGETRIGEMTRIFIAHEETGLIEVRHVSFNIDIEHQGKGIASALGKHVESAYKKLGVHAISLTAGGTVGRYAWAVQGFDFANALAYLIADGFKVRLNQELEDNPSLIKNKEDYLLELSKFEHPWEFAQWNPFNEEDGKHFGKRAMLNKDVLKNIHNFVPEYEAIKYLQDENEPSYAMSQIYWETRDAKNKKSGIEKQLDDELGDLTDPEFEKDILQAIRHLDEYEGLLEKQLSPGPPPGPPPREGLKWKPTTHRWIRPHDGAEFSHEGERLDRVEEDKEDIKGSLNSKLGGKTYPEVSPIISTLTEEEMDYFIDNASENLQPMDYQFGLLVLGIFGRNDSIREKAVNKYESNFPNRFELGWAKGFLSKDADEIERTIGDILARSSKGGLGADLIQVAAKVEFGLEGSLNLTRIGEVDSSQISEEVKSVFRGIYNKTQDFYSDKGLETIKLYRGLSRRSTGSNAIESWTKSRNVAKEFASGDAYGSQKTRPGEKSQVLTKEFLISNILFSFESNPSLLPLGSKEKEVVILNDAEQDSLLSMFLVATTDVSNENNLELQAPPGPPPRHGLQWKPTTHRWIRPEELEVPAVRATGPWVYHKTNLEALKGIQESGFNQGDFIEGISSFRKLDFPGDVSLRVRQGNLPPGQVGEYQRGMKWHLPAFADTGLSISPENIEIYLDAEGRPASLQADGEWKQLIKPSTVNTVDYGDSLKKTEFSSDKYPKRTDQPGMSSATNQKQIDDILASDKEFITVWHGTTRGGAEEILKTGELRGYGGFGPGVTLHPYRARAYAGFKSREQTAILEFEIPREYFRYFEGEHGGLGADELLLDLSKLREAGISPTIAIDPTTVRFVTDDAGEHFEGLYNPVSKPADMEEGTVKLTGSYDAFERFNAPRESYINERGEDASRYSEEAYTSEYMTTSDETNRRLRWAYQLSDGRQVSLQGYLKLVHPELARTISSGPKGIDRVWPKLSLEEKMTLVDSVPLEEALPRASIARTDSWREAISPLMDELTTWLRVNEHPLSDVANAESALADGLKKYFFEAWNEILRSSSVEKQLPPGPPPREGLKWKPTTRRWIRPKEVSAFQELKTLISEDPASQQILDTLSQHGKPYLVGGAVRDALLGYPSKDVDIEVHGIELDNLAEIVERDLGGSKDQLGKQFGVFKVGNVDVALPRTETKTGTKHTDFDIKPDPNLALEHAARRRDFTINALMYDYENDEILDFFGGKEDIASRTIKHIDDETFVEDPLRVYRAAQFAARFGFSIDPSTIALARSMDLSDLPKERVFEELTKLLLRSPSPSVGLQALEDLGVLDKQMPELKDLQGTVQRDDYHAEGDVFNHTKMVIDVAAQVSKQFDKEKDRQIIMLASLCHDIGKPATTDEQEHAYGHEEAGMEIARQFLSRLTDDKEIIDTVVKIVGIHLTPLQYYRQRKELKDSTLRKLINSHGTHFLSLLTAVSEADGTGRLFRQPDGSTQSPTNDANEWFRANIKRVSEESGSTSAGKLKPLITGKDLINMGFSQGKQIGEVLQEIQRQQEEGTLTTLEDAKKFVSDIYNSGFEKQAPPGPPPREGLRWKAQTHRWIRPKEDSSEDRWGPGGKEAHLANLKSGNEEQERNLSEQFQALNLISHKDLATSGERNLVSFDEASSIADQSGFLDSGKEFADLVKDVEKHETITVWHGTNLANAQGIVESGEIYGDGSFGGGITLSPEEAEGFAGGRRIMTEGRKTDRVKVILQFELPAHQFKDFMPDIHAGSNSYTYRSVRTPVRISNPGTIKIIFDEEGKLDHSLRTLDESYGGVSEKLLDTLRGNIETKEPWEMTKEEFIANPPKGFRFESGREGILANRHKSKGETIVHDSFFELDVNGKKSLLAHEEGHDLVSDVVPQGIKEGGLMDPFKVGDEPLSIHTLYEAQWNYRPVTPEEIIADAYSELITEVDGMSEDQIAEFYRIAPLAAKEWAEKKERIPKGNGAYRTYLFDSSGERVPKYDALFHAVAKSALKQGKFVPEEVFLVYPDLLVSIEKQAPPGPPPREGLKWKPTTHRWIRPKEQEVPDFNELARIEREAEITQGVKDFLKVDFNTLVNIYVSSSTIQSVESKNALVVVNKLSDIIEEDRKVVLGEQFAMEGKFKLKDWIEGKIFSIMGMRAILSEMRGDTLDRESLKMQAIGVFQSHGDVEDIDDERMEGLIDGALNLGRMSLSSIEFDKEGNMIGTSTKAFEELLKREQKFAEKRTKELFGDSITVWRALYGPVALEIAKQLNEEGEATVNSFPMSSYTQDFTAALAFGQQQGGGQPFIIFRREIPAEDILSAWYSNNTFLDSMPHQKEIVINPKNLQFTLSEDSIIWKGPGIPARTNVPEEPEEEPEEEEERPVRSRLVRRKTALVEEGR